MPTSPNAPPAAQPGTFGAAQRAAKKPTRPAWPSNFTELTHEEQEVHVLAQLRHMRARAKFGSPAYEALLHAGVALDLRMKARVPTTSGALQ